jgi:predicted nucleotide-binding protein
MNGDEPHIQFLKRLTDKSRTACERAVALLWWLSRDDHNFAATASQLASWIQAAGYPNPNQTRLRNSLKKDRRTTQAAKAEFRLRIDARPVLDEQYVGYLEKVPSRVEQRNEERPKAPSPAAESPAVSPTLPLVFIGSSVEGLEVAQALQEGLEHVAETTLWSQGVFGLSDGTLETLDDIAREYDFAVLVLSPDDLTTKRGAQKPSARDNVLLELGLFIGALGRRRTFIVYARDTEIHLPTDLAGVTPATFASKRTDRNLTAAVGPVCTKITRELKRQGRRPR